MLQIYPTSFALIERTAAAGRSLARGTETVAAGGPDLTWLLGVVAILLAAIAAMAFAFRKVVMGSMQNRAAKRDMRILDVLPLGGKRQLAVVRCYDRTFALGLGEKSVELVAEMDHDAIEADRAQREAARGKGLSVPERAAAFQERLKSAKARLLGAHDLIPGPASKRAKAEPSEAAARLEVQLEAQRRNQPMPEPAQLEAQDNVVPTAAAPEVQPFVPPPVPAPALGEVAARAGSNREFLA